MSAITKPIYLDYAATTPTDPCVAEKMLQCLTQKTVFGNPASQHEYGYQAREMVESAREQIAATIKAEPSEIIFTSGATESINLAIKGAARLYQRKGKHIITLKTEHKAVLDTCLHLEKEGYRVTYLAPDANGLLSVETLQQAFTDETILVSILHVNNETGVIQDIAALAKLTEARGILLHVDAAQTIGKIDLNLVDIPADLVSFCAHKVYGPKGVGALYLRKKPRVRVEPLLHGGGHEQGMRSGTLATHQIVGMGEAFLIAREQMVMEQKRITQLRDIFLQGLRDIPNLQMNIQQAFCVPHIINLRFDGMLADEILRQLPLIAASTASACQGKGSEGSHVLRAMGLTDEQAKSSVRFSFGRFTTNEEAQKAAEMIRGLFAGDLSLRGALQPKQSI